MTELNFKKLAKIVSAFVGIFTVILCVHIYMVTHANKSTAIKRVMARIDFNQDINEEDAGKITAWLYNQKGVDHAVCNTQSKIAIFTFSTAQNSADAIINRFKVDTKYDAHRFLPSTDEMMAGCPVAMGSWSDKVLGFFKNM